MFDMIYNGRTCREMAVAVTTRPSIPAPQMRGEWVDVGADGSLLVTDGTYDNIEIEVQLNFVCPRDKVGAQYRRLKAWIQGQGELSFTDDLDVYYRVKAAGVSDFSRRTKRGADVSVLFICDPYTYFREGKNPVVNSYTNRTISLFNPGAVAKPLYHIYGGADYLPAGIKVNDGEWFYLYTATDIYLDTERMMVYSGDGESLNASTKGDLATLWLPHGSNNIGVQAAGAGAAAKVEITPRWRTL